MKSAKNVIKTTLYLISILKYNKLVRDKIPEIIKSKGAVPITHIASDTEFEQKLKAKLQEEVDEFLTDSNKEELADILEILDAFCKMYQFDKAEVEKIRGKKLEQNGSFTKKIILEEVK